MKKIKEGQGFVCKDEAEKIEIFTRLEKLGYPIYEGSFKDGKIGKHYNSGALAILFQGNKFQGAPRSFLKEILNQEEFFSEVLTASQDWTPYPKPKKLLLGDQIDGTFDYYVEVLGEYEGCFIDCSGEQWNFAKEIPVPRYTHEQLVEILGHEFIQIN
jgi:hypothetical protein